jgi:hypothetical protein
MKVAEALLLRKQLEAKVKQLEPLRIQGENGVYAEKVERISVGENVDQVKFAIPRLTLADITKTYDHYASELRKLDASIQKANWTYDVDYKEVKLPEKEVK